MRPDDPLAKKEYVMANELSVLPLILPNRFRVQSELANWFGEYYENLNVLFTSNLSSNASVIVSRGLAYAIVVEGLIPFWDQSQITYRPLYPYLAAPSVLTWKRGQPFGLAATKFIDYIKCFLGINKA